MLLSLLVNKINVHYNKIALRFIGDSNVVKTREMDRTWYYCLKETKSYFLLTVCLYCVYIHICLHGVLHRLNTLLSIVWANAPDQIELEKHDTFCCCFYALTRMHTTHNVHCTNKNNINCNVTYSEICAFSFLPLQLMVSSVQVGLDDWNQTEGTKVRMQY